MTQLPNHYLSFISKSFLLVGVGVCLFIATLFPRHSYAQMATSSDWVGLYPVGAPDDASQLISKKYVNCQIAPGLPVNAGTCTFPMPSQPGTYELRLYANDTFTRLATSNPITVTGNTTTTPTVTFTPTITDTPTAIPTNIPEPTDTPVPNTTQLSFTVYLHGIGESGDNPNPTNFIDSNHAPLHPERMVTLEILNNLAQPIATDTGRMVYDNTNGNFSGQIGFGNAIPSGNYSIRLTTASYLRQVINPLVYITAGQVTPVTQTTEQPANTLIAGDITGDDSIDILDYNVLRDCGYGMLNPVPMNSDDPSNPFTSSPCIDHDTNAASDLNDDGIVNIDDYNLFLRELAVHNGD